MERDFIELRALASCFQRVRNIGVLFRSIRDQYENIHARCVVKKRRQK